MFRKQVRLFGRSVPIAVLLLGLTAITALAAFLLVQQISGDATAASAPTLSYPSGDWNCQILSGIGSIDSCVTTGDDLSFSLSGIDDDTVFSAYRMMQASGTVPINATLDASGLPAEAQAVMSGTTVINDVVNPWEVRFDVTFAGLAPSQVLGSLPMSITWAVGP